MDLLLKIREKVVRFSHPVPASSDLKESEQDVCFQNKARRQRLLLKDHALDQLEDVIHTIMRSLPEELQHEISAH